MHLINYDVSDTKRYIKIADWTLDIFIEVIPGDSFTTRVQEVIFIFVEEFLKVFYEDVSCFSSFAFLRY